MCQHSRVAAQYPEIPSEIANTPRIARVDRWIDLRHRLGRSGSRKALLRFMCSASGYAPFAGQTRAHLVDAGRGRTTHKYQIAGIGWGKSEWLATETAGLATANPGCWHAVVAPTYDQARHVILPKIMDRFEAMHARGYPIVKRLHKSILVVELVCGGLIFVRSADKTGNLRGFEFATFAFEEAEYARQPMDAFNDLAGRIRDPRAYFRQISAISSPRGDTGVLGHFLAARRRLDPSLSKAERIAYLRSWWIGRGRSYDNPHLVDGYLEALTAGYSKRRYAQEVEGEILSHEHVVWPEYEPERHVIARGYDSSLPYDIACDWGDRWPHFLWIQRLPTGSAIIFDEYCEDGAPSDHQIATLEKRCARLGKPPEFAAVERASRLMRRKLHNAFPSTRVRMMESRQEQSILEGVEVVRDMLDPLDEEPKLYVSRRLAVDPPRRGIHNCLRKLRNQVRADGRVLPKPHKDNVHDHGADALRYWCRAFGRDHARTFTTPMNLAGGMRRGADIEAMKRALGEL